MNNNTNPLPEIAALVLAALLVIGGVVLLYVGKIDFVAATVMFGSALALFGGNLALKAPSPTQQSQIAAIATQQSATISQMVSQQAPTQAAAPMAAEPQPAPKFTTPVPQPPFVPPFTNTVTSQSPSQFIPMPAAPAPFPYQPSSTYPQMPAVQP